MGLAELVGIGCIGQATYLMIRERGREKRELKETLERTFVACNIQTVMKERDSKKAFTPDIKKIFKTEYGFEVLAVLPVGFSIKNFRKFIEPIEESTASKVIVKQVKGRLIKIQLGMQPVEVKMDFKTDLVKDGQLKVPYYTPFGLRHLDFNDEATCHIIVAGTTRMGKTVFLRLLFTQLILATKGKVKFFYINNKIEDYYPMSGVPQITEPAETEEEALQMLEDVKYEINRRKQKLRSAKDSVNVRQYNQKHPDDQMESMFVVFDEYGRFSESEEIQEKVIEIAETAGYLDIHLVISTQRPDATSVLKPRIRANILTRVCFQTADSKNSEMVVHTDQAFYLDEIKGRAVVLDGMQMIGQIPYITETQTQSLLEPYRVEEGEIEIDEERSDDTESTETLPSFVSGSVGGVDMPDESETVCDDQQDNETVSKGWARLADTPT